MKLELLDQPFPAEDIEWRIQQAGKNNNGMWAKVLAYITNRAIMKRLDEVCGKTGWRNEYRDIPNGGGVECGISIKFDGEWITKWDAAENTDIEGVKGGRSGAMKRAAVQWGIGRYLYNLTEGFATVSTERIAGYHYAKTKEGVFYWLPPALPAWALPAIQQDTQQPAIDAESILHAFCEYASSANEIETLKQHYARTWKQLAGYKEHQDKCSDVTGIRIKELKQPAYDDDIPL